MGFDSLGAETETVPETETDFFTYAITSTVYIVHIVHTVHTPETQTNFYIIFPKNIGFIYI